MQCDALLLGIFFLRSLGRCNVKVLFEGKKYLYLNCIVNFKRVIIIIILPMSLSSSSATATNPTSERKRKRLKPDNIYMKVSAAFYVLTCPG